MTGKTNEIWIAKVPWKNVFGSDFKIEIEFETIYKSWNWNRNREKTSITKNLNATRQEVNI